MSAKPKIFITRILPHLAHELIEPICEIDQWMDPLPPNRDILAKRIQSCDGVITLLTDRMDGELMDLAPKLKVISNFAVGYNNIDIQAATDRGIAVGNTPGVLTEATADIAVTLLLAASRRLTESCDDAKAGRWKTWEPMGWLGQDLPGKTLGIVGMGRIGFATAKRLHFGWGMKVLYTSRKPHPEMETEIQAKRVSMDELLGQSDFVSVHTDLNPETQGLFVTEQFAKMKKTAVFINTSRGPIVDQSALAEALRSGTIFSAGLDVTDPEPLPPTHELYSLKNCVIAPHIASATIDTRNAMAKICALNLIAGVSGKPLQSIVNPGVVRK